MATIEPLNSAMTYQAQAAAKPQAVAPVNTEVPEDGQTVNVDETTASVTRSQPEDEKSGGEAGSQQQSANAKTQQQANIRQAREQQQSEQLKKAIMEMNRRINNSNEEAVFGVHEDTNRIMIKIMDKETKEVIKEFPPEKTLDMIARIWEMAGILVDEKM
ncbi:MAG: flagellar protein FlaG [Lachnospiraceae bacterium]|jgi:flagellar protein FlaG|nr:flagellar protein FlaG [Lachnospiraceae bacterium]MCI9398047.1 flagellar protein FlaG [Lachnospiraceae bacterium]